MNFGAFFMGTALTVRELVGERTIFRREQAAGLSTSAYLAAKVAVFGAVAVIQSAILVLIVVIGKGAPPGAAMLGSPTLELFVGVAATCVAAAMLGLLVSSLAQTSNQVLPLTVVTLMAQMVLAGGFIPVTGRALDPVSWLDPVAVGFGSDRVDRRSDEQLGVDPAGLALEAHRVGVDVSTSSCSPSCRCSTRGSCGGGSGSRGREIARVCAQETSAYRSTVSGRRASRRASTCARSSCAEVVFGSTGAPMLTCIGAGE